MQSYFGYYSQFLQAVNDVREKGEKDLPDIWKRCFMNIINSTETNGGSAIVRYVGTKLLSCFADNETIVKMLPYILTYSRHLGLPSRIGYIVDGVVLSRKESDYYLPDGFTENIFFQDEMEEDQIWFSTSKNR